MKRVFVDTSAIFALVDTDDENHDLASEWLARSASDLEVILVTHNYVVVETAALVHRRLGTTELRVFFDALLPAITVRYVDEHLHRAGQAAHLAASRRRPSLVDWVSFEMMREQEIESAFAFDRDFTEQGFAVVP